MKYYHIILWLDKHPEYIESTIELCGLNEKRYKIFHFDSYVALIKFYFDHYDDVDIVIANYCLDKISTFLRNIFDNKESMGKINNGFELFDRLNMIADPNFILFTSFIEKDDETLRRYLCYSNFHYAQKQVPNEVKTIIEQLICKKYETTN